jgi:hypothetical protein
VVCEWLDIAEVDVGSSSSGSSGLAGASSITRAFSASGRGFLQGGSASGGGAAAAAAGGGGGGGRSACVPDEFTLLQVSLCACGGGTSVGRTPGPPPLCCADLVC